ncbi:hypothetical protein [Peribacillus frigoritolerans]|uniref:Uncharacterized protein n=1 Tax=Peribacillus castrilensis TaxID=2897690 RepID=A0AAW9N8A0_9BACI|nr:hypothetical protein [Peribacillus castrilensis]MEC0347034.1 hypothetical protein [Peribacillus castrilensis]
MIKSILKLKKEELNAVFDSLLIGSSVNKTFFKYIMFVLLVFLFIMFIIFPEQLIVLFTTLNLSVFSIEINLLYLISIVSILSGNKNILSVLNNDFYKFYGNKYLFIFYYLKEKFFILFLLLIVEFLILESFIFSFISVQSFLVSIVLIILFITINIFHLKFSTRYSFDIEKLKIVLSLVIFSILLWFISIEFLIFGKIPFYLVINIPLFIFVANLFIYSELIFLNLNYRQLFFMHKYLKTPIIKIYKKSIIYRKTWPLYCSMCFLIAFFLFFNDFSFLNIGVYILNSIFSFIILLFLSYKIVANESYKGQKNYFMYFIFMEIFFVFIAINIFYFR